MGKAKILITGGVGYIGSHTLVELIVSDFEILVVDNLCNSSTAVLRRVEEITAQPISFIEGDVRNGGLLASILNDDQFDAVIHFAGLKSVGESVAEPLKYYDNNVHGSQVLLQAMADAGVFKLVFSSSATVYGDPAEVLISEQCPLRRSTNPYGRSKFMVEEILRDLSAADPRWSFAILRYFNPVGAHVSGLIGEDPKGIPNNLLPYISQVAVGKLAELAVFGGDYPTPDGTGVRDYIHVMDLAQGHVAALRYLDKHCGTHTWNLGMGRGYSVLEMIKAFEQASGRTVPYRIVDRRPGDVAACYASPDKAKAELGWTAERSLADMMADAWRWQSNNPDGYR